MSNVEQMEDNLSYMKDFNGLTDGQKADSENRHRKRLKPHSADSMYHLQLLCQGLSEAHRYLRILYSHELSDPLSEIKGMAMHQENWLVGGHGKKRAIRVYQVRKMRTGLSAAYRDSKRVGKRRQRSLI